jgi:hypothetical protein
MDTQAHRKHVVSGLRDLAEFLHTCDLSIRLNPAMAIEATYHVLERDTDKAREEFNHLSQFLTDVSDDSRPFVRLVYRHNQTMQHTASLLFGDGAVSYRVLWIEPLETENDNDE